MRALLWLSSAVLVASLATPTRAFAEDDPGMDPAPAAPAAPTPGGAASARDAFERGEVLREEGKWPEAAKAYGASLDADESNYLAHVRYQEAVGEAGRGADLPAEYDGLLKETATPAMRLHRLRLDSPTLRIDALTALLKATPGDPFVLLELGRAQLSAKDVAGAKRSLEAAFAQKPDAADVLWLSTEALRRSNDLAGARARLEGVVKQQPDAYEAILRLARIDLLEGKHESAMKRAEAVLGMRPTYLATFLLRSEAASRLGRLEDARASIDAALKIQPEDPDALLASADLLAKGAGDDGLKKAVEVYKKALTIKGVSQLRAYYGLAWAQERLNQLPDAATSYREASLLAPGDAAVVNSIGVVLLRQKRFQDAIVQFKKAIDLDPAAPEAYANLGAVSDEQADWNEAIKWYQKVLALRGQDRNVRALLNCAFDYEALSTYKKAEELLKKAKAVRPDDPEILTFIGDNLTFQKRWKEAAKSYQEALKLDEKNRFAWRGLGISLSQDDKIDEGIEALEKAKALKADDTTTLLILGTLYLGKEDLEKALACFEAYVKAGGSNGDVPMLIDNIKKELEKQK